MSDMPTADPKDVARIVRDPIADKYWTGDRWSAQRGDAKLYPNEHEAMRACTAHKLRGVELVVCAPGLGVELAATPVTRQGRKT